jgi:hypothetical protein
MNMVQHYKLLLGPDSFVSFQTGQGYPPVTFEVGVQLAILVCRNSGLC